MSEMKLLPAVIPSPQLNTIHNMDAMELLKRMPSGSVNCIVTSPPYFGLRDYGVPGQIGLEDTPQEFISKMVALFREARRVLRDDGTCFINIGDSYANDEKWGGATGGKHVNGLHGETGVGRAKKATGLPGKNLMLIPFRLAIALQDDGWILRSDIIWSKPNPMPESVTDRPTKAHEYIFLLTKSPRYWYDADAIREPLTDATLDRDKSPRGRRQNGGGSEISLSGIEYTLELGNMESNPLGRNKRTVWAIPTEPNSFAHFATFPQKLIEPMILAGCPDKVCVECGAAWVREVEVSGGTIGKSWVDHSEDQERGVTRHGSTKDMKDGSYTRRTLGFKPTCDCNAPTRPGIVFDPFMGSGTTGLVARKHGRRYLGSELNPEYVAIARERLRLPFEERHVQHENKVDDLPLFAGLTA